MVDTKTKTKTKSKKAARLDETKSRLTAKLGVIKADIDARTTDLEILRSRRHKSEVWMDNARLRKDLKRKINILDIKETRRMVKICSEFLTTDDVHGAYLHDTFLAPQARTNIRPEVIDSIKANLRTSMLRASDIVKLVDRMVDIERDRDMLTKDIREQRKDLKQEEYVAYLQRQDIKGKSGEEPVRREIYGLRLMYGNTLSLLKDPTAGETEAIRNAERERADSSDMAVKVMATLRDGKRDDDAKECAMNVT